MGQKKKTKCDILTNSYDFFTTNTNIIKLNMSSILYKIISEWNKKKILNNGVMKKKVKNSY
jgi:hypothetical protein